VVGEGGRPLLAVATFQAIDCIMVECAVLVVFTIFPNATVSIHVSPMQRSPLSEINKLSLSHVDAAARPPERYSVPAAFVRYIHGDDEGVCVGWDDDADEDDEDEDDNVPDADMKGSMADRVNDEGGVTFSLEGGLVERDAPCFECSCLTNLILRVSICFFISSISCWTCCVFE
jgi:hypothetical protein